MARISSRGIALTAGTAAAAIGAEKLAHADSRIGIECLGAVLGSYAALRGSKEIRSIGAAVAAVSVLSLMVPWEKTVYSIEDSFNNTRAAAQVRDNGQPKEGSCVVRMPLETGRPTELVQVFLNKHPAETHIAAPLATDGIPGTLTLNALRLYAQATTADATAALRSGACLDNMPHFDPPHA